MDLSIVVVNFNTRELLRACLASIAAETTGIQYEVILVDNASTDGSREMLEGEFPGIKCIYNSQNRGFAAANNQAIRVAEGRYILLLNSDTKVLDGAIQKTLQFMDRTPDTGIAGCKLLNPDGTLQPSCRSFPSVWNIFAETFFLYILFERTELFGRYHMTHFDHNKIRRVDVVKGAFMMIRREVFERVGLLDESYFMYTEETDYCYRMNAIGYHTYFFPWASVVHHEGGSVENFERLFEQFHSTQIQFLRKHFRGIRKHTTVFLKQVGIAIRVPVYFIAGFLKSDPTFLKKSRACSLLFRKIRQGAL